eukprot:g1806.t1
MSRSLLLSCILTIMARNAKVDIVEIMAFLKQHGSAMNECDLAKEMLTLSSRLPSSQRVSVWRDATVALHSAADQSSTRIDKANTARNDVREGFEHHTRAGKWQLAAAVLMNSDRDEMVRACFLMCPLSIRSLIVNAPREAAEVCSRFMASYPWVVFAVAGEEYTWPVVVPLQPEEGVKPPLPSLATWLAEYSTCVLRYIGSRKRQVENGHVCTWINLKCHTMSVIELGNMLSFLGQNRCRWVDMNGSEIVQHFCGHGYFPLAAEFLSFLATLRTRESATQVERASLREDFFSAFTRAVGSASSLGRPEVVRDLFEICSDVPTANAALDVLLQSEQGHAFIEDAALGLACTLGSAEIMGLLASKDLNISSNGYRRMALSSTYNMMLEEGARDLLQKQFA